MLIYAGAISGGLSIFTFNEPALWLKACDNAWLVNRKVCSICVVYTYIIIRPLIKIDYNTRSFFHAYITGD